MQFSCKTAGAWGCGWSTSAGSAEELKAKVADHVRRAHGVKNVTDTIANYAVKVAQGGR